MTEPATGSANRVEKNNSGGRESLMFITAARRLRLSRIRRMGLQPTGRGSAYRPGADGPNVTVGEADDEEDHALRISATASAGIFISCASKSCDGSPLAIGRALFRRRGWSHLTNDPSPSPGTNVAA